MLKTILLSLWIVGITLASSVGTAWWTSNSAKATSPQPAEKLEHKKVRSLSIPILAKSEVQGYVILQLAYVADANLLKQQAIPPESYLLDDAIEIIYGDKNFDHKNLDRYDLKKLTRMLVERLRVKLKSDVVKDVIIEDFNYVSKADLQR